MSGWQVLIWAATCGVGMLAFLKGVANEVDRVEANLRRLEQGERRALLKRRQIADEDVTASPAAAA
jgi:hypothetical protein